MKHGNVAAIKWCFNIGCGKSYSQNDVLEIMKYSCSTSTQRLLCDGFREIDEKRVLRNPKKKIDLDDASVSLIAMIESYADINERSGERLCTVLHKV